MSEEIWHYEKDGNSEGPVTEEVMMELIQEGVIKKTTLVWRHPLEHWVTAQEVRVFKPFFVPKPPPLPGSAPEPKPPEANTPFSAPGSTTVPTQQTQVPNQPAWQEQLQTKKAPAQKTIQHEPPKQTYHPPLPEEFDTEHVSQVRPWVRLFARYLDYFVFTYLTGSIAFLTIISPDDLFALTALELILIMYAPYFIWAIIEAYLLSAFGTTPGKYVFGTSVTDENGYKLSYKGALSRSFRVLYKGLAFGLPIITLVAQIFGYLNLTKNKITSWDKASGSKVVHDEYNVLSPIFLFLILVVVLVISTSISLS